MALVLQDMITEVRDHLGGRTDVTDGRIVRALNLGQEHLARQHAFEETNRLLRGQSLLANERFLEFDSLPSGFRARDIREVYSFRIVPGDGRARKLVYRSTRSLDRLIPETGFWDPSIPTHYTIWEDKFEFWPIPDEAYPYELRILKWPIDFTTSQLQATSILSGKDDIIVTLAVSWLFSQLGEYDRGARFFNIAKARTDAAVSEDQERPDQEIVSDRGRSGTSYSLGRPWADPFVRYTR